ncbi:MAG: aldo/keto reductase [Acidobacteriota bacterium]
METRTTRRGFFNLGLAVPAAAAWTSRPPVAVPPRQSQPPELRYRTLGKTGLKVTTVGFGCMITSDGTVIERAADLGINYFDTARGYQRGNNERMVGAALKSRRDRVFISSKTGARDKAGALAHLETSLKELQTDHLDIWYLHAMSRPEELTDELCDALEQARQAGKIRFAGVSLHSGHQELIPVLAANPHIDVLLVSYNFTMDPSLERLLEAAAGAGKGIVAMKVMAGGFRRVREGDPLHARLTAEGAMLAALKWAIRQPFVHTSIPSITDVDQLQENLRAMAEPISEAETLLLQARSEELRPLYCRMCGSCAGVCPKGLPVADVLRYLTYAEGYGQYYLAREGYQTLPRELQEVRCADCTGCSVRCPHGVQVQARLRHAQELLA